MVRALFCLIAGTLLISSLATPWVYSAALHWQPGLTWPFSRVYDRVAMVTAALLLWRLRACFDLRALAAYLGRSRLALKLLRVAAGMAVSGAGIALLLPLLVSGGKLVWSEQTAGYYLYKLLVKAIPAALLISLIEESTFRVLIFQALKRRWSVLGAALGCSAVYALVHFIAPVKEFAYRRFDPLAGFNYLAEIGARYFDADLYPAMFGLLLVGLVLCYVMQRTDSLSLCVGLHAGWAGGLKMVKHLAVIAPAVRVDVELGRRYFLLADPLAWCAIVLAFGVMWFMIEKLRWFKEDERR